MIVDTTMERCHVDITGPHPQTCRGSKYILTSIDAFSKWADAFAVPNREAKTVARVLVQQVFCRLGTTVHQSPSYSHNYLMLLRDLRAPVDLVFVIPADQPAASYDDFSGTPIALLIDNAGELDEHLMQEICRLLEIDKQHTSFYHPETNSVGERFHGTLNSMMAE